jgi:glutamine---fructose-6-phosphate transaminase (isomerizing)
MCGIFGAVISERSELRRSPELERSVERLFLLSESRGKEAAGLAVTRDDALVVYKAAVPARDMLRSPDYRAFFKEAVRAGHNGLAFIGHSRLVTDGVRELNKNNQPVLGRGIAGIHNGIVVNHAALWQRHPELQRQFDVDSEIIFALLRAAVDRGASLIEATRAVFAEIQGATSIAALFDDRDRLLLATNNGSIYYRHAPQAGAFVFSSERYIMDQFGDARGAVVRDRETVHVRPGHAVIVDLSDLSATPFSLDGSALDGSASNEHASNGHTNGHASDGHANGQLGGASNGHVSAIAVDTARLQRRTLIDRAPADRQSALPPPPALDLDRLQRRFPYRTLRDSLRRCTRCVLPETMPFVDFDDHGVCAYCRTRTPLVWRGAEALEQLVAPYRRRDGRPDCLVSVSGGRDSMYGLHYIKTVLGLSPVAYTYDWGMVTDLARRNVSRICGKLGIEHILVSADIQTKRENIRKNVEAWLAQPSLGTVPLFMAGDKAYFYHLNKTREQLGVELSFLCENPFERTDFKTGFAGVAQRFTPESGFQLSLKDKLALGGYFARAFAGNRRYINRSLLDTAKAFAYYYVIKHDYHNLYWYTGWDEATIESTLLGDYDFERAEDTETTWRIGDGTAPFYNYIYYAVAGLTENDTFRSNQIRQGVLTRERALALVERDNRPRFQSIDWYLRTIGCTRSLEDVLETIERIPKLTAR